MSLLCGMANGYPMVSTGKQLTDAPVADMDHTTESLYFGFTTAQTAVQICGVLTMFDLPIMILVAICAVIGWYKSEVSE